MVATMERVSVNGVELEFDAAGSGEAVVFIHGSGFADSFLPLAIEPALRDHYRMIRYRRRGHAGSAPIDGPVSVADHAGDCRALLGALDVKLAHVVGHSYGACVALQVAVDAPGVVHSLALFELPLYAVPSAQQVFEVMGPIMERYLAGDRMAAADGVFSETKLWRPGTFRTQQIKQSVLFLSGTESLPFFIEGRDLFHSWLPHTEDDAMPAANHLLHMRNPADAAARLATFLKRHAVAA
ncbi:MAG: alpha/beta fold hydrolase [Pseudonocardiaceae bacterium]